MDERSNTADNRRKAGGKPFVKGDPRINRKGRPKNFDGLRELAKSIAEEVAKNRDTGGDLVIDGHKVTIAEAILRNWAVSKNPQLQRQFIEVAYGKVPDNITVSRDSVEDLSVVVDLIQQAKERGE